MSNDEAANEGGTGARQRRRFTRSIRGRLIILVTSVVVLATCLLTTAGYLFVRGLLRQQVERELKMIAADRIRLLRSYVDEHRKLAALIASRTRLRENWARFTDGQTDEATFRQQTGPILEDARASVDQLRAVSLADTSGRIVASTDAEAVGGSAAGQDVFEMGLDTSAFGTPQRLGGGRAFTMLAAPATLRGRTLGVVLAEMDISALASRLGAGEPADGRQVRLVGRVGDDAVELLSSRPDAADDDVSVSHAPLLDAATSATPSVRPTFVETSDHHGQAVLVAYGAIGYRGWGLIVSVDAQTAYAPVWLLRRVSIMVGALVLLIALLAAYAVTRRITAPILALSDTARAIAGGDLNTRADIGANDEVGDLGRIFNEMAAALRLHRDELERLIDLRTGELRQSNRELRDSEALYHSLVEHVPVNIFRKDLDGVFLFCNQLFAESLGVEAHEVVGKTDHDFFPREQAEKYRQDDRGVIEAAAVFHDVEEHDDEFGRRRYVEVWKSPVRDHAGRIVGVQGIFWDVTERKHAEQSLRISEERTRLIIETAQQCYIGMDSEGMIIDWNPKAAQTFGWTRDQAVGRELAGTIIPQRFREAHRQGIARFLESGEGPVLNRQVEIVGLRRDGQEFPVELWITPLQQGSSYVFHAFVHDITERKQAEDSLRRSQEALREAKEAAEAANRAKSEFLANVSHEIRTPMNGILGMAELLANTDLNDRQREYLHLARQSAETLLRLLNDILDFSKIEAGKIELESIPFRLVDTVGDPLQALAMQADRKGLELACRIPPDVPDRLIGDPVRLQQIIVNLVGNAVKFTERGEVVVEVEPVGEAANGRVTLQFCVRDTGIGIAPDKQGRVFEAFSQADSSMSRRYGGTGLGLSISRELAAMMGGRMWVESDEGRGSSFFFTASFGVQRGEDEPAAEPAALHGLRVLVVDDNLTNRRILQELLANWRMQPVVTTGGDEALDALACAHDDGRPVGLILLDIMMPGMDGFTFAQHVRSDARFATLPIIVLSSAGRTGDRRRIEQLGIRRFLHKPVKSSDLLDAIADAAGPEAQAWAAPDEATPGSPAARSLDVLLAEDGLVNQKVACELLRQRGHRVTVVGNGQDAVEAVGAHAFDLVLMDLQMPTMDGMTAARRIRDRERGGGGRTPIIAMTAHAMEEDRRQCQEAGMDGFLPKPIRSRELFALIESVADGQGPSPAAAAAPRASVGAAALAAPRQTPAPQRGGTDADEADAPVADRAEALKQAGGDQGLLRELIGIFRRDDAPRLAAQIEQALASGDAATLQRAAHTLRGGVNLFGAAHAAHAAARLESAAADGKLDNAPALWRTLRDRLDALNRQLDQWTD